MAGNAGLPLGPNGFLNLSLEYGNAKPTNRSIQRSGAQGIIDAGNGNIRNPAQVWGSPLVEDDLKLFGNFGSLFDNGVQFYGHTNYASRTVTGGFYFRNPHTRGGVFRGPVVDGMPTLLVGDRVWAETAPNSRAAPAGREPGAGGCPIVPIVGNAPDADALAAVEADPNCFTLYSRFPGGFTPQFGGDYRDYSLVSGLRGFTSGGLSWDASVNIGSAEVDQFIFDTVNASLGYDTPTSFKPGIYAQDDVNLNFDVSMPLTDVVNLAAGTEWRREQFTIGAGDRDSWQIGPYAAQGFSSGSNGFNGYRADTTAGRWSRGNAAVYGDLELTDPGGMWNFGTALRLENFQDFGTTTNGKVSTRVALNDAFSLRAAVSTGFRAPTPGQQNAFNVTTAFIGGQLTNQGVVPATSAVAMVRGGGQLQPERSRNYSAGAVVDQGPFTFTADFFRIDIDDRVGLSQEISLTEDEIVVLLAEGIPEARNFPVFRFFLNDFSTTTQGLDLISTLAVGRTTMSAVFNYTDTALKNIQSSVIDDFRIATLEAGTAEHPLELRRQPRRRPLEADHPGELLRRVLGQRGRPERNRSGPRDGALAVRALFRQGAARRRGRHPVRRRRRAGDRRGEPAEHLPRHQPVRRLLRRQPVRPVLAVRVQRRLLLHTRQLRVGRLGVCAAEVRASETSNATARSRQLGSHVHPDTARRLRTPAPVGEWAGKRTTFKNNQEGII